MDLQDRYDELDNIISSIRILKDEITDRDYIEQLELIQFQAQNELEEVEEQLKAEQEAEMKEEEREYWMEAI